MIVITIAKLVANVIVVTLELAPFVPSGDLCNRIIIWSMEFSLIEAIYLEFFVIIYFLKTRLVVLNKMLKFKLGRRTVTKVELNQFKRLWCLIDDIVGEINNCYGKLFLVQFGILFTEIIRSTGLAIYKVDTQEIRIMDELEVISLHMLNSKDDSWNSNLYNNFNTTISLKTVRTENVCRKVESTNI
ncbi:unnamed protein product [Acanthoscelides obtectus]|uniref:Uncharacterized protein n=1 Tax=Acanthoscelides obtectus TaxID=200917 RepID=A0A9P0M5Z3_ACAOB|nr:unnamed protein product [Acanthoscelides obtectus]CAK1645015.1 hypothetical protein AOBTE_LOCUS13988 [Acanthoscelides obtectus]